jgi:hypothetical protein
MHNDAAQTESAANINTITSALRIIIDFSSYTNCSLGAVFLFFEAAYDGILHNGNSLCD